MSMRTKWKKNKQVQQKEGFQLYFHVNEKKNGKNENKYKYNKKKVFNYISMSMRKQNGKNEKKNRYNKKKVFNYISMSMRTK